MDRHSGEDVGQQRVFKRTLIVVACAQVLAGLGLAAGVTVGALMAEEILNSTGLSGVPSGLFTLGSACAALYVGKLSQRFGRRVGLSTGYLAGALGGIGVVIAAIYSNPVLLFLSFVVYGSGMSTSLQSRYAGTDVATANRRGQAVSTVLFATTLGAVAGPNLVDPMGRVAKALDIPELAGPFLLSIAAYGIAATILTIFLRPDPLLYARKVAAEATVASKRVIAESSGGSRRGLAMGAMVMIITQMVMVGIMTMTPIHMRAHGHGLSATGLVIAVHVAGMYLPSPITGWLLDRIGRAPLLLAAALTLPVAGIVAGFGPSDSVPTIAFALCLLGIGWNLGLVSGTDMVTENTTLENRASTQGSIDVGVALSGAGGGVMSGVVVASTSYAFLGVLGGVLALALIPIVILSSSQSVEQAPAT